MNVRVFTCILTAVAIGLIAQIAGAQFSLVVPPPVPFPQAQTASPRVSPSYTYKQGVGGFAETASEAMLRRRGFSEIRTFNNPSGHGLDRIAFKYDSAGQLLDARLVEAKYNSARLGQTKSGRQMSRQWMLDRLKELRNSGPAGRDAARKLRQVTKMRRVPIAALGEVFQLEPNGRYTLLDNTGETVKGTGRLEKLLGRMTSHGPEAMQDWAQSTTARLPDIKTTTHASFIRDVTSPRLAATRAARQAIATKGTKSVIKTTSHCVAKVLVRAAGPVGLAVGVVIDGYDLYVVFDDFTAGRITQEQMIIQVAGIGGGIVGAGAGAFLGAKTGAVIGLIGGPVAWITVPVAAVLGGALGGVLGYFWGKELGETAAVHVLQSDSPDFLERAEAAILND